MVKRACTVCGRLSDTSRCPDHRQRAWATDRTRAQRTGSGWEQQARARRVIARHGGVCHCCSRPGATIADHVIALADGGADAEENMRPICEACNRLKVGQEAARGRARRAGKPANPEAP